MNKIKDIRKNELWLPDSWGSSTEGFSFTITLSKNPRSKN